MAVPKKKKSSSRSRMRKGSNGCYDAAFPNVITNKTTGEFQLSHQISVDGFYNGRQVVKSKKKKASQEE
jgi:large subunit ribosomal protein L32